MEKFPLTPVEKRGEYYFKREDKYEVCGVRGGKARAAHQWMFSNISRSELLKKKCINFGLDTQCSQKCKRNNPVVQLSLDGKLIAQYNSSKEASDNTLVSRANISNCLNNKKEHVVGFRWMRLCDWGKDIHMVNGEYIETEKEYERLHTLVSLRRQA